MMAWLTYKWFLLFVTFVQCAPEGYNYKKPDIAFGSSHQVNIETQNLAGQTFQNTVSYSVAHDDYGLRNEQVQNSGGIASTAFDLEQDNLEPSIASLPLADTNNGVFVQNSASYNIQNSVPVASDNLNGAVPPVLQLQAPVVNVPSNNYFQNGASVNNGAEFNLQNGAYNAPVQSLSSPVNLQIASQNYQNTQQIIQTQSQQLGNGQSGPQFNQISAPVIMKHIYFHVPPPDVEQTFSAPPPPQSKKTYKILFIKLPQQSYRNNVQLQSSIRPVAPIEEKTLIYVLVKKPEEQSQVIIPASPKLSEHEVLFVRYKDNPKTNTEEVARVVEIPKRNPQINVQVLQPGFVNGKW